MRPKMLLMILNFVPTLISGKAVSGIRSEFLFILMFPEALIVGLLLLKSKIYHHFSGRTLLQ
jgi:hypothetical protein